MMILNKYLFNSKFILFLIKMEETFQMFLSKKHSIQQEDLDIATKCFEAMSGNIIFGPFFLEKCQSNEYIEYYNSILCFKAWIYNFWGSLNMDQKSQIIQSLIQLISCNKNLSLPILDIFTIVIQNDSEILNFFHEYIPILLPNIDLNEEMNLESFVFFLSKLFELSKDHFSFYYLIFKQNFYPMFTDSSILKTNENIPFKTYNYLIKCFSSLFFKVNADVNDLIPPIEFSKIIISNFDDSRLVSRCSKFFKTCYQKLKNLEIMNSIFNDILFLHINNINRFIQKGDDYVVFNLLRTIHIIGVVPECFEIFKNAAYLTQDNINDFYNNPFVFYSIVYSSSAFENSPRGFALCALDTLFTKNTDLIQNLARLEINELSTRIFGYLSTTNIKRNQLFISIRQEFINSVLQLESNDPIFMASKIYLISKTTHLFDDYYLNNLFLAYFESSNDVIRLLLCSIANKMHSFSQEIPNLLLCFLPSCQKHSAFKALNRIALFQPEIIVNHAKPIIILNKFSIEKELAELIEDDEYEIDSGKICDNLKLLRIFTNQFLLLIQLDDTITFINQLISYDFYDEDIYCEISNFIINIFCECSKNEVNALIFEKIMECMISNLYNSHNQNDFIDNYGKIFLFAISNNRQMFLNLKISSLLVNICLGVLGVNLTGDSKPKHPPPILISCDIISFVVQTDQYFDCQLLIQYSDAFLSRENENPLYFLGYSNVLSSIIVKEHKNNQINPTIFLLGIEKNYYVRTYDKHLTAAALICFNDETLLNAAKVLYQQEIDQNNMSEKEYEIYINSLNLPISIAESSVDYSFPAPIQELNLFDGDTKRK